MAFQGPLAEGRRPFGVPALHHHADRRDQGVSVADRVAADCWLFLWTTTPLLPVAMEVIAAWGFSYSGTAFVWAELNPSGIGFHTGMGFTTRKNVELCLLGKRGSPRILAHDVRELIVTPRREHSRKPDEQYARIERFCAGPYLELWARQRRPEWTSVGDEVDHFEAADRQQSN